MIISFFEEFPTRENLDKLKLVRWPTKLYLAARSLEEFNSIRSKIKNKNVDEIIYWPVLGRKEGYWISPFSKRKALVRVFDEVEGRDVPVMVDAELPTTQNLLLYLTQFLNFFRNKRLIEDFVKKRKRVYVAEYYPEGKRKEAFLSAWGLSFNPEMFGNKVIKMVYHSMHDFDEEFIRDELKRGLKEHGKDFLVAYGAIAQGVHQNESILSCEQLKKDLEIAQDVGVKEVVIFRLGGLDGVYAEVVRKFI